MKYKFCEMATVVVTGANSGKRSVAVAVVGMRGELIDVGNVTVPANKEIPLEGTLIEVRYLYYYESGALFQPNFEFVRHDKDCADFHHTLKRKPEEIMAA